MYLCLTSSIFDSALRSGVCRAVYAIRNGFGLLLISIFLLRALEINTSNSRSILDWSNQLTLDLGLDDMIIMIEVEF
jgi:hypothetical protein